MASLDDADLCARRVCVPANGDPALCKKFCADNDDCNGGKTGGPGSACIVNILGPNDKILAKGCSIDCDPLDD